MQLSGRYVVECHTYTYPHMLTYVYNMRDGLSDYVSVMDSCWPYYRNTRYVMRVIVYACVIIYVRVTGG